MHDIASRCHHAALITVDVDQLGVNSRCIPGCSEWKMEQAVSEDAEEEALCSRRQLEDF
jgi:hypothetical protein